MKVRSSVAYSSQIRAALLLQPASFSSRVKNRSCSSGSLSSSCIPICIPIQQQRMQCSGG
ncbi:Uncharacterised protein [Vibrio cholerae]|nr:Uncharacterised protein [Vibrio cholerae]